MFLPVQGLYGATNLVVPPALLYEYKPQVRLPSSRFVPDCLQTVFFRPYPRGPPKILLRQIARWLSGIFYWVYTYKQEVAYGCLRVQTGLRGQVP